MNQEYKNLRKALYRHSPRFKQKQTLVFVRFVLKLALFEALVVAFAVGSYFLSPFAVYAFIIIGIVAFGYLLKKSGLPGTRTFGTIIDIKRITRGVDRNGGGVVRYSMDMMQKNFSVFTITEPNGKKREILPGRVTVAPQHYGKYPVLRSDLRGVGLTKVSIPTEHIEDAKALKIIAELAGYRGMIAGQVLDLQNENNDCADEKVLYEIYFNKTAKLIMAPILVACALSGNKYYKNLYDYGFNLGILFQIIDDVMDVEGTLESIGKTPNKDKDSNKLTSVRVFGLEGAKNRAKFHYEQCKGALIGVKNSEFLALFADAMFVRRK